MKFLPPTGASRHFVPFSKQQLLGIHALIDARKIPVGKSQDFFLQVADLESTLPNQAYSQDLGRYRSLTKAPSIAGGISGIALIAFILTLFFPENDALREANISLAASGAPSLSTILGILTCALLAGYAATWIYVRSLSAKLAGKGLSKWWGHVLHRWAPDLAKQHDTSTLAPETIAHLVAVQTRIQDVSLDLGPSPVPDKQTPESEKRIKRSKRKKRVQ